MSISSRIVEGQQELVIRNQPEITEAVLGALIEFVTQVPDVSVLQQLLHQMEATCKLHASPDFTLWEQDQEQLLYLHEFLKKVRFGQSGDSID